MPHLLKQACNKLDKRMHFTEKCSCHCCVPSKIFKLTILSPNAHLFEKDRQRKNVNIKIPKKIS